ncbi:MAG TPA: LysR family transcriptional regulator [Bryobacteraceae bacterium]|nr:LysR family transcriptional regulator [Bryobacteraceae bacterium]
MNLETIRLFRDIAQTRNLTRAAEMNQVSQSAASQALKALEEALGVRLLNRSVRPVELTEAGRIYYEFCRDVLRRYEEFEAALEKVRGHIGGSVRIASIYSVGISEMARLEQEFARRLPGAELRVEYLRPEKVYEAVLADRADLGLVSYPEPKRQITVIPWRQEQMVLALAPSHPWAGRQSVRPEELDGQDFVGFDQDLPISRDIRRFLREHGVEVNWVFHFDNIQTMKEAVALGTGMAILPAPVLRDDIEQGRLAAVPLEAPGLVRPLGIIHRKRKQFNRAAQVFLEILRSEPGQTALLDSASSRRG